MGYISVSKYYKEFEIRTKIFRQDYFKLTKEKIKASVEIQIYQVESKNLRVASQVKEDLISNVENIYGQLEKIHKSGKNKIKKTGIKISALYRSLLQRPHGYCDFHFVIDTKGKVIFNSASDGLLKGESYFYLKNSKGESFIKNIIGIANKTQSGFYQYRWKIASDVEKDIYPRLVYIKKFKPLNWIIVDGVYLDNIDLEVKNKVLERMNSIAGLFENDTYLFVYELLRTKEGRDYFKILVHHDEDLIDRTFSVETAAGENKEFITRLLSGLKEKNGIFLQHTDVRPETGKKTDKISYFEMYPRWSWIFARGFYSEDLSKIITGQKAKFKQDIRKEIKSFVFLLLIFMGLSVAVSIVFSHGIHRIITNYKDKVTRQNSELKNREKELIKLNKILDETGRRDPLTNLSNRRDMNERLEHYQALFQRNKRPFAIIMADIDYFKSINDAYGHDMGDFILIWISEFLRDTVRAQDIVSRWGGEEFLLLLPETSLKGAVVLAEKMREKISDTPVIRQETHLNVTLTFGVSVYGRIEDMEDVIKRADDALYRGKKNGRNQVVAQDS
jgi:diguanylate cyclase (GGDEF)-like protein